MKVRWEKQKFGDVCELRKGKKPALHNTQSADAKPYLSARYLRGAEPIEFALVSDKNSIIVDPGEIIIICDGSNSGETFIGFSGVLSSTMAKIRHGKEIDTRFLMHFLSSLFEKFNAAKTGSAIPHLDLQALRNENIPLPNLAEQHRIATLLDEAFDSIATAKANAEKNLQNARALFESHLQSVFTQRGEGWIEKPLEDIATFSQGIQVGLENQSTEMADGLVRFIRIVDYTQKTKDLRFVKDPGHRYWVKESDIVMVRYGTPGLIGRGIAGVIANNLFKISVLDELISNEYILLFLRQDKIQNYLASQGSSTMPALTFKQLGKVAIKYPSNKNEQEKIVQKIQGMNIEVERLESIYQRKLQLLENMKQSLLHQAFSGLF